MDYGSGRQIYTLGSARLPMYCTYSARPDGYMPPTSPSPMNMGSLLPNQRIVQCTGDPFLGSSRLVVMPPRLRRVYAGLDFDDDDDEDIPDPPSVTTKVPSGSKVSHFLDELVNSSEIDDIESETRKIRRDADRVLQRLQESTKKKPVRLSSVYFPDLTYSATSSAYPSRAYTPPRRTTPARDPTPDYDEYVRPRRPINLVPISRLAHDPIAQVQSEINRKAVYSENCRKINDSIRGVPLRRNKSKKDEVDAVKNNINVRAQYASLRAAANVGLRKPNDYLMP